MLPNTFSPYLVILKKKTKDSGNYAIYPQIVSRERELHIDFGDPHMKSET